MLFLKIYSATSCKIIPLKFTEKPTNIILQQFMLQLQYKSFYDC